MENTKKGRIGLTTVEALNRLQIAIKAELQQKQFSYSSRSWIRDAYHHNSSNSTFTWTSAIVICIEVLVLLWYQIYSHEKLRSLTADILFLVFFLLLNVFIVAWDNVLRHTEMQSRVRSVLQVLEEESKSCLSWEIGHYSNRHTPQSPCISAQWTCRDNHIVNLPCSLLVEGDVILLRPGHAAPGKCKPFHRSSVAQHSLNSGQVFAPVDENFNENFNSPQIRKPAKTIEFVMLESPLIVSIRCALENSLKRPVTLFNKECHAILFHYLERMIIPITLVITMFMGSIHAAYFDSRNSDWTEHLLLRPALAVMPLLPLALPACWIFLNAYGNAHLLAFMCSSKEISVEDGESRGKKEWKPVDPFDEIEEITPPLLEQAVKWKDLKDIFVDLILGRNGYLWRSANLLQVLGSLTTLCCVDKKGILSWPNPTAEKVFFLKSLKSKSNSEVSTHMFNGGGEGDQEFSDSKDEVLDLKRLLKMNKRLDVRDHMYHPGSLVEVLDLTHNLHSPFGIQFDDPNWKLFIGNLKPLGLGILLNTCNPKAQEHYTQFCDHIACESLYNDAAVPVVNKRCLCELAKQIGFSDSVVDFYELEQQLGIFRHVHPEIVQKGKLARSLNFPRLKMPFPNLSCAVVKDLHRGSYQLFSQGTADLVLDACNEYWDGEDICVLTESDRKRILDFYHRSSLTAHCMGYAYSPMNEALSQSFSDSYIELPSEGYHLFSALKTTTSSPRSWDLHCSDSCTKHSLNRYLSSDSLMIMDQDDKSDELHHGTNNCLHQLGNEIFIGMVTMQYQACPDFVQLIEQLDKACIRFVHFSKENELRSRVFSEKMGLESGWNCHISLLGDEKCLKNEKSSFSIPASPFQKHFSRQEAREDSKEKRKKEVPMRHSSAPNIINLETTVVKFEEEISIHSRSEDSVSVCNSLSNRLQTGDCFFNDHEFNSKKSISAMDDIFIVETSNLSHSPSHVTESTDQSAPVTFDMSNRAKLPKGTENIRPHIENVDNVPLQVSLFTDCTAEATREMICIMQEYGEVVCCLGSSANSQNMKIFLQADASIAIEPLHPQLCKQQPVFNSSYQRSSLGPAGLSSVLNSLPCGLNFHREDPISLYQLIMEARHYMCSVHNGLQFMLCCCLSITLFQVIAMVFFLPLMLPLTHMLWMICLEIPLLCVSLLGTPLDSQVMTLATGKNLKVASKQAFFFFLACYFAKFCPSVIVAISCFACAINTFCPLYPDNGTDPCWMFLTNEKKHLHHFASLESWFSALTVSQNVVSFFFMVYFVLISMGFIHRSCLLWKNNPFTNKYWTMTAVLVIVLQFAFNVIDIAVHVTGDLKPLTILKHIPYHVWLLSCLWPFVLVPLNEVVKQHEIKVNVRQQKRARLEFCTKLGMNSPF